MAAKGLLAVKQVSSSFFLKGKGTLPPQLSFSVRKFNIRKILQELGKEIFFGIQFVLNGLEQKMFHLFVLLNLIQSLLLPVKPVYLIIINKTSLIVPAPVIIIILRH